MTFVQVQRIIEKTAWLPQGGEGKFLYATLPLAGCMGMKNVYGVNFKSSIAIAESGFVHWYHDMEGLRATAKHFLGRLHNDKDFIGEIERLWEAPRERLVGKAQEIIASDLRAAHLGELLDEFKDLCDLDVRRWDFVVFIDTFDVDGDRIVRDAVSAWRPELLEHIAVLLHSEEQSFVQRERNGLLRIALAVKHKGLHGDSLEDALRVHQRKFFWYKNNFAHGRILDAGHFRQELEMLLRKPLDEMEEERRKAGGVEVSRRRAALLVGAPDGLVRTLDFFRWMTALRDRRKEVTCVALAALRKLIETIGERMDIDPELLENMLFWEADALEGGREQLVATLRERERLAMLMMVGDERIVLSGHAAEQAHQCVERTLAAASQEIKGMCASKGTVRGTVKVINKVQDFPRFERGDILVSTMTRPEYLPLIEKAAAIVTDEGGITCHAAIVSRELKIPCVIGTQRATKMLRDGDLVEVDATKGVVRRL
jgi:phosphohistidine swiveling domain-containing protein